MSNSDSARTTDTEAAPTRAIVESDANAAYIEKRPAVNKSGAEQPVWWGGYQSSKVLRGLGVVEQKIGTKEAGCRRRG